MKRTVKLTESKLRNMIQEAVDGAMAQRRPVRKAQPKRLTEDRLRNMINEAVKKAINEDYFSDQAYKQYDEAQRCWRATTEQERRRYGDFNTFFAQNYPSAAKFINGSVSAEDEAAGWQQQRSRNHTMGDVNPYMRNGNNWDKESLNRG